VTRPRWPYVKPLENLKAQVEQQFNILRGMLAEHVDDVNKKHNENQEAVESLRQGQTRIAKILETFTDLLPDIRAGIEADQRAIYHRKRLRVIVVTIIGVLVTISALMPLAEKLWLLKQFIHFGWA
jgi:hypothetical protein